MQGENSIPTCPVYTYICMLQERRGRVDRVTQPYFYLLEMFWGIWLQEIGLTP